jgi:hypothetical protein
MKRFFFPTTALAALAVLALGALPSEAHGTAGGAPSRACSIPCSGWIIC